MQSYKAVFLDIDGTILRANHTIEDSTVKAVKQAKNKGIEIFLATGRPLHEVQDIAETLNIDSFIGYNGAYAVYKNQILVNEPISANIIEHYLAVANKNQHDLVLYTNQMNLFTSVTNQTVKQFIDYFDLTETTIYSNDYIHDILGITFMNISPDQPKLYDLPEEEIYFSQVNVKGLEHCYDVIRENVNKGHAIKTILDTLKIPASEAIAFGDGMNDKQMLQFAGESFAMGNANPELFQYAKHRTTSVEDSGIYNGLKTLGVVD